MNGDCAMEAVAYSQPYRCSTLTQVSVSISAWSYELFGCRKVTSSLEICLLPGCVRLLGLILKPEDRGSTFLRNFEETSIALHDTLHITHRSNRCVNLNTKSDIYN
jgi:hypothetical protein